MRLSKYIFGLRLASAALAGLLISGCALFQNIETPYFSFSYYLLTYADTETVINMDRADTSTPPNPPPLNPTAWRLAVLAAAQSARNGGIHPTEIADFVLTQLGSDPAVHPDFGVEVCSANADMAGMDFELPGDATDLGSVTIQSPLTNTNNGRFVCNVPSIRRPSAIDALGPRNWTNGSEQTMLTFIIRVNGVDWKTTSLANKVTVNYNAGNNHASGALWFMATDQTQGSGWFNSFDTVIVAPIGGFVLEG